jgi:hypothetical protein
MSFDLLPSELVLLVITFLNTRDVVLLGGTCRVLHGIAEQERAKRQDIDRLLSKYVQDTQGFRRLMRETGAIIVGDVARAFFTGDEPPKELQLLFDSHHPESFQHRVQSWTAFFGNVVKPQVNKLRKKVILDATREVSCSEDIGNTNIVILKMDRNVSCFGGMTTLLFLFDMCQSWDPL